MLLSLYPLISLSVLNFYILPSTLRPTKPEMYPPTLNFIFLLLATANFNRVDAVGVNWGTWASQPLPPREVVELLKSNSITRVRLFDSDPKVLEALSGSNIGVTVGIPNSMLRTFNSSKKAVDSWVHDNVTRYFSAGKSGVRIESIAVGDEPFHKMYGEQFHPYVIGAAINVELALAKANLGSGMKVVVPCSSDSIQSESGLPSKAHFRPELNRTMNELLSLLDKHHSPFYVTISPFVSFKQDKNTSLDFALFKEAARPRSDSHRKYKNSFDMSYDTVVAALSAAGFPSMDIVVAKVGWPTDGAPNATSQTAEVFMKRLMEHLRGKSGTPLRPKSTPTETFIFSLLDENERSIASGNFERHWGVFTFDGQAKYRVDFGQGTKGLVNAQNVGYLSPKWCVVDNNKDMSNASSRALDACSAADCTALSPGGSCSNISYPGNISYAFNSYYQQHDQRQDSCDFGGLGLVTTVDPSFRTCRFSVELNTSGAAGSLLRICIIWWLIPLTVNNLILMLI